jgi:alpha-L-fucosidase
MPTDRRQFLQTLLAAATLPGMHVRGLLNRATALRLPSPTNAQLAWQRDELAMFLHFGVNTFTDKEWGDGTEDPRIFNPTAFDARQWARTARAAGFKAMILTAKHHDGFCLWPTRTTTHSVASSPWRNGEGDVVREFVTACRAEGLKPGLYLSPWDRNAAVYGDSPRYNEFYIAQLTELLTQYGTIHEVWFDGANGEGPNGKRQTYDWPRTWSTVRRLQPDAVMFSDAGPDVRWIGNERGAAGTTNWSTVRPEIVTVPGMSGDEVMRSLQDGDRDGTVWRPGETDVSIRPGWFHHPAEDARVRTPEDLVQLYFTSVGRNSKLLLNVPPKRDGLLHEQDVSALRAMHSQLTALLSQHVAARATHQFRVLPGQRAELITTLSNPALVDLIELREDIARGQRVARFQVEGHDGTTWRSLVCGTTIGYRRFESVRRAHYHRFRVSLNECLAAPVTVEMHCYLRT